MERGADLHMAELMPLPLTVSCFSKIQIGRTFLALAHPGSPGKRAVKRVCVCVYNHGCTTICMNTAGCKTGWVNYANEPSQAALKRSIQDAYVARLIAFKKILIYLFLRSAVQPVVQPPVKCRHSYSQSYIWLYNQL